MDGMDVSLITTAEYGSSPARLDADTSEIRVTPVGSEPDPARR
jgi:hypothetical protein